MFDVRTIRLCYSFLAFNMFLFMFCFKVIFSYADAFRVTPFVIFVMRVAVCLARSVALRFWKRFLCYTLGGP